MNYFDDMSESMILQELMQTVDIESVKIALEGAGFTTLSKNTCKFNRVTPTDDGDNNIIDEVEVDDDAERISINWVRKHWDHADNDAFVLFNGYIDDTDALNFLMEKLTKG